MRATSAHSSKADLRRLARVPWVRLAAFLLCCGLPTSAQAHTAIQGMGEVGSGLLHPLLTAPHLLVLLALGFLLGQQQPFQIGPPAVAFAGGALVGILGTTTGLVTGVLTPVLMLLALTTGGLVALAASWPILVRLSLCGAAALALGLDSGVDSGTLAIPAAKTLAATWVSLLLLVINVAFYVSLLPPRRWVQTGVRVVGSWIVAIALLMLAFALKKV